MKSKRFIGAALAAVTILGITGCSSQPEYSKPAETTGPPLELNSEAESALSEIEMEDAKKLENPMVKWLSFWDINPSDNKAYPTELKLFEDNYGGHIEYISTTFEQKFEKLSTLVSSDESPDMFPAADLDGFPKCAANNLFAPFDDYIDFDSELWAQTKPVCDKFMFDGKHYVAVTGTDAGVVMIYNKHVVSNNGLDDPYQLLLEDNWTWDTFSEMMHKFCNPAEDKYAVDGWWFEFALSATTGVPYIGMENGKVVNNLRDPMIAYAQEYLQEMNKKEYPFPKAQNNWQVYPQNIGSGKTLFYPVGIWALYEVDLEKYGGAEEIGFVTMPRCPKADKYYLPTGLDAFALCSGAPNPEGVAAFLNCRRLATEDPTTKEIAKQQYHEDYGWTDEMWDMLQTAQRLTAENPVIDYYTGVSDRLYEMLNNPCKESFNAGVSWGQTCDSIYSAVDAEIEKFNSKAN